MSDEPTDQLTLLMKAIGDPNLAPTRVLKPGESISEEQKQRIVGRVFERGMQLYVLQGFLWMIMMAKAEGVQRGLSTIAAGASPKTEPE